MDSFRVAAAIFLLLARTFSSNGEETKSFSITTVIKNRFSETTISSEVINDAEVSDEIEFHVMLPKEAFITHFNMIINGTKYDGEIEEKQKAEKIFKEAKARGKTAGIVRTVKQTNKVFKTSVNIAAGETVTFNLIYQQILRKSAGKYRNAIILLGGMLDVSVVPQINVYICESQAITNITVPKVVSSDEGTYEHDAAIQFKGNWGHVEFLNIKLDAKPDSKNVLDYQAGNFTNTTYRGGKELSSGSFVVEYELENIDKGGKILVDEGYLLHFFSPPIKKPARRYVFVLDISGSMTGRKLQQMTDAMENIFGKFGEEDKLGVIKFTTNFHTWRNGILSYGTADSIESAIKFLKYDHSNAYTYIWKALKKALEMLIEDTKNEEINPENNMIILLTDGLGSLPKERVLENVEELGKNRFAIHTIGFGHGVDADMLKALAANNHGSWKQILEGFDAHLQIENYMDELGVSLLHGIEFQYPSIVEETQLQRDKYLFGSEVVAISKMKRDVDMTNSEPQHVKIKGRSRDTDVIMEAQFQLDATPNECEHPQVQSVRDFGKKAFGMTKVEEALRLYDAESNSIEKEKLKENAIKLSILYQLVTPVTSMLVVKPEDKAELEQAAELREIVEPTEPPLVAYSAGGGPWHRIAPSYSGYGDPHFVVKLSMDINVCFNWPLYGRRVVNLLYDKDNAIIINALMMSFDNGKDKENKTHVGLFITASVIILPKENIEIAINDERALVIDTSEKNKQDDVLYLPLQTTTSYNATYENVQFAVIKTNESNFYNTLQITTKGKITIVVDIRHQKPSINTSVPHLDISLADSEGLSDNLSGLFGILHIQKEMQKVKVRIEDNKNTQHTKKTKLLVFKDRKIPTRRIEQRVPHVNETLDCWKIGDVEKLFGMSLEAFDQKSLFEVPK